MGLWSRGPPDDGPADVGRDISLGRVGEPAGALVVLGTLALAAVGASYPIRIHRVPLALILLGKALASPRLAWTSALTVVFYSRIAVPETDFR